MPSIPGHKGNASQNHVKISPHSCWNGYHQEEQTTNAGEDLRKKEPSYTGGYNVN
jgi:hypothetical protein